MLLGYCCINMDLRKKGIYTNRTLILKNFSMPKVSSLALQNVKDLQTILEYNENKNIKCFRITSSLFPHATNGNVSYMPDQLADGEEIVHKLRQIGKWAYEHNHVLSFHPGPYTCLGSERPDVITNSVKEVELHNWIADQLCYDAPNLVCNINWHVGRKYEKGVAKKWIDGWQKLSDSAKRRSCLENDDKASGWSIQKLYKEIHQEIGIRLTHDLHHSLFSKEQDVTLEREFEIAKQTWKGDWQEVHYSESADEKKLSAAHSDYYKNPVPQFVQNEERAYVHLECKMKELALLDYREKFDAPQKEESGL